VANGCKELGYQELAEKLQHYTETQPQIKNSRKREYVLKILYSHRSHLTPEEVYLAVKQEIDPKVSLSTVYRILSFLEEAGVVRQIDLGQEGKHYEIESGCHHDHLICSSCRKVVEFFNPDLEALQEKIASAEGFTLLGHDMKLQGICRECREKKN